MLCIWHSFLVLFENYKVDFTLLKVRYGAGMGTVPDFQERVPERSSKKNAILCDPGTPVPGLERPKIVRSPVLLRYLKIFKKRSSAIQNF